MATETDRTLARTDDDRSLDRLVAEIVLNRRRRYVLYYLSERSEPVSVADLALQVAAWERSTTPDEVATAHEESVYSSISRSHLPYLEAQGLVTYDGHVDRVTGRVDDPTVELYVANDPRTAVSWHKVYLALTAISTLLLGVTEAGIPPFGDLRPLVTATLIVTLFAAASVAYWYDVYRWRRRTEEDPPDFLVSIDEEVPDEEGAEDGKDDHNEGGGLE